MTTSSPWSDSGGRTLPQFKWANALAPAEGGHPGLRTGVVLEEDGVLIERDVPVMMRDGVTIFVDVFRPRTSSAVPAILTLSPYGKHAPKGLHLFPGAD